MVRLEPKRAVRSPEAGCPTDGPASFRQLLRAGCAANAMRRREFLWPRCIRRPQPEGAGCPSDVAVRAHLLGRASLTMFPTRARHGRRLVGCPRAMVRLLLPRAA